MACGLDVDTESKENRHGALIVGLCIVYSGPTRNSDDAMADLTRHAKMHYL